MGTGEERGEEANEVFPYKGLRLDKIRFRQKVSTPHAREQYYSPSFFVYVYLLFCLFCVGNMWAFLSSECLLRLTTLEVFIVSFS